MEIKSFPKKECIRLTGRAYRDLQEAVLERDNNTCRKCGRWTKNTPHHIIFRSQGGPDTIENMETLCGPLEIDCHAKEHR